jgi:serine/threonine protein kinase
MPFVEQTLADLLKKQKKPMSARVAIAIAGRLAKGLAAAHEKKVIHRDLKPANVLYDEPNRNVLIADFGLARFVHQWTEESVGKPKGTPKYMSPEQGRGQADLIGPPSDVYSLGIIFYEMLTGRTPFNGTVLEVMMQHWQDQPRPPSEVNRDIDPRLDAICLKSLEKDPKDRYPNGKAFASALADYLQLIDQNPQRRESPFQEILNLDPEPEQHSEPKPKPGIQPTKPLVGKMQAKSPMLAPTLLELEQDAIPLAQEERYPTPNRTSLEERLRRGWRTVAVCLLSVCLLAMIMIYLQSRTPVEEHTLNPPRVASFPTLSKNKFDKNTEWNAAEKLLELKSEVKYLSFSISAPDEEKTTSVSNAAELPRERDFVIRYISMTFATKDIDAKIRAALTGLSGLRTISFTQITSLSDATLATVATCPQLQFVTLEDNPRITDAGLLAFATHPTIKELQLQHLYLSPSNWGRVLGALPALTKLSLDKSLVTDDVLKYLKQANALESLNLNNNYSTASRTSRVTRGGFESLASLKTLSNLNLSSYPVEDNWLPVLYGLSLKELNLENTPVTSGGESAIKKALTDCKIRFTTRS